MQSFFDHKCSLTRLSVTSAHPALYGPSVGRPQASFNQPVKGPLWAADNDFYSAFEIDAVADVLAAAGVEIDRRTGNGAVPTDFLDAYANPDFDIVWVAGHGQIDHWRDGSTELIAGENCRVGIDELLAQDQRDGERRLAVFNICDGGASAVNGGIQKLGFAPMLASSRQATISHLWPVNPLIAAAFGVGLAKALADGAGLHAAFDRALAFKGGSGDIVKHAMQRRGKELQFHGKGSLWK